MTPTNDRHPALPYSQPPYNQSFRSWYWEQVRLEVVEHYNHYGSILCLCTAMRWVYLKLAPHCRQMAQSEEARLRKVYKIRRFLHELSGDMFTNYWWPLNERGYLARLKACERMKL